MSEESISHNVTVSVCLFRLQRRDKAHNALRKESVTVIIEAIIEIWRRIAYSHSVSASRINSEMYEGKSVLYNYSGNGVINKVWSLGPEVIYNTFLYYW